MRFTIGSLMTGLVLAVVAILALRTWQGASVFTPPPPAAGAAPGAIDETGAVMLGSARATDVALHQSDTWDGGLDAATW
jgi:hypothetical protein